jgi:type IV secretion system protein VirB10
MPQNNLPLPSEPLLPSSDSQGQPKILINDEEAKKRKDAKRKSSIILVAGTESKKTQEQIQQEENFKVRGNIELVLGRGKIIDAVLERAISTDFGGEVRSVISRDVFSESGKNILVPKGSRVFGTYSTGIDGAYGRISIEWNRIDLASGYTLSLQGAGIDNLGRKGYQGRVDNKFKERFSNAILMSAFNIGFANALDKVVAPPTSTQTAATNTSIATNMQNTALAIYNAKAADASEDVTINKICSSTQALITDKTSTAYTTLSQACTSLITNANIGSTTGQRLSSLMNTVNSAAASLLTSTTTATTPTQAQNASKQAFTDVTNTVKDMLTQQQFKPTITIDQGTAVKIYVTKDYVFPKAVLSRSRLVK